MPGAEGAVPGVPGAGAVPGERCPHPTDRFGLSHGRDPGAAIGQGHHFTGGKDGVERRHFLVVWRESHWGFSLLKVRVMISSYSQISLILKERGLYRVYSSESGNPGAILESAYNKNKAREIRTVFLGCKSRLYLMEPARFCL